jgi:hemoglobin/transferrin/lactoferrin receptor protein
MIGLLSVFLPGLALAADAGVTESGDKEVFELEHVVVVAGKIPRLQSDVAGQVTVIDGELISRRLIEDVNGLLGYEPGLELETEGTRFAASAINIRGVGGNRVDIEIDGVPVRDRFSIGAYSNAGRALVETDRIKRVEVLYGPASVMYGSNALGGVVAITTWDPSDLLLKTEKPYWMSVRAGYRGSNESRSGSGVVAWGEGQHGLLAAATVRSGHELDNQASSDIPNDPQDWDSRDFQFRYTFDTAAGNRLRLTAQGTERQVKTEVNSLLGYGRRFRWTTALNGDDEDKSRRIALDYDFSFASRGQGTIRAFSVDQETDQLTHEVRAKAPTPVENHRRFNYQQEISGIESFLFRDYRWGSSEHRLGLGAEWLRSDVSELRDGLQTNLQTGESTNIILGENMPVRDFPVSRTDEYGVWLQDEIRLADGRWELVPGLRWDRSKLKPRPDEIWLEDNPGTAVVEVSESRVTPRLGILWHPSEQWTAYGQYSGGFRAPPFEDANIGFTIPLFGFRAIPNPDLRSETSSGLEFGLRFHRPGSRISLALFHTDYDDFIESRVLIGFDPATGDLIFQSRNVDRARIYGADLRLDQDLSAWSSALDGWMLNLAAYWAEGENRGTDQPLNGIAPPQAVLGLNWTDASGRWDFAANSVFTTEKKGKDIDESDGQRFATPSWVTVDLSAGWRPTERLELRAAVFNLFDETYWRWLDVSNLSPGDPMIPLLSRPGRTYSLTASFTF